MVSVRGISSFDSPATPFQTDSSSDEAVLAGLGSAPTSDLLLASTQGSLSQWKNWLYENVGADNQHIYLLWDGPHDYIVRVIMDQNVIAVQPASVVLKTSIGPAISSKFSPRALNFTVRHDSSSLRSSTGTKFQFGYDVTRESEAKRREYSLAGEPVMDLISIETLAEGSMDRLRSEIKLERGAPPSVRAVMQEALALGGNIRWRRVWEDPNTGQKHGIDVVLSLKTEGIVEYGPGGKPGGIDAKAEIEASVRFFGNIANAADIHQLQDMASQAIARLLIRDETPPVQLETRNFGDPNLARQRSTAQLFYGTSPWQLAPDHVSGGRNHGNMAVDLAIRVNRVLHWTGYLGKNNWITSTQQAEKYLANLWRDLSDEQRQHFANYLANPLSINFAIQDIAQANATYRDTHDISPKADMYRKLFLDQI